MIKHKDDRNRGERFDSIIDRRKKRLRGPLEIGGKVLVLAERLREKDAHGRLFKSTTENKTFFNRDRIVKISERSKLNNSTYLYWLKENSQKKKKDFKGKNYSH